MAESIRIALIDDEADFCEDWQKILLREGYDCATYSDSREAICMLREHPVALALVDLRMPNFDGLTVLQEIRKSSSDTVVVLITAYATIQTAIKAIGEGAFDYLPKPFTRSQLLEAISRGLKSRKCRTQNHSSASLDFSRIIGSSPAIREVMETAKRAALSSCNVVLLGESGTGKELVARTIHANSPRGSGPFVPVDCAALPETLLESELFGHEKGSFTDAHASRAGLVETAAGGTVFLDEIAELRTPTQAKLLRVLEDRSVRRVGGRTVIPVDVRFIAATNQNLEELVRLRHFREDLFYRLNVLALEIPPLRSRNIDVPLLAQHFLDQCACKLERRIEGISAAAMMVLEKYDWPGNVRELRNIVERACALTQSDYIAPMDLPAHMLRSTEPDSTGSLVEDKRQMVHAFEIGKIHKLLAQTGGNVSEAARLASMDRAAFQRIMRKHGIRSDTFRKSS
ncbi:MAG: sigma-54-dependent Fis family transcriptional regulator [Acidobacteria bacterium]|nr:sigma-54-dependent Fis family transcriptional regulator [Acidobacteriota bacterium]